MFEIMITGGFSASHKLRGYDGQCENLHGHNWRVDVAAQSAQLDKIDVVVDFEEVKRELAVILEDFDHQNLNLLPVFEKQNPSAESIAEYIHIRLVKALRPEHYKISSVKVWETKDACATYWQTD